MRAKWLVVLAIALVFSGCSTMTKPRIQKVGKGTFFVEVEEFTLNNAEIEDLEEASGGKVVVLQDENATAEATIQLKRGNYEITVYALGPSFDEDGFYLTVGDAAEERLWPENPGELLPTLDVVNYTQEATGPCDILLSFGEPNVQLDRVQFKSVP